jgi:hypothetical protein
VKLHAPFHIQKNAASQWELYAFRNMLDFFGWLTTGYFYCETLSVRTRGQRQ